MHKVICTLAIILSSAASWAALPGFNEIKGITSNYVIKNNDGFVDFSLVIPAMNTEELINFDLGKVLSPETDSIKVFSYNLEVPSNLSVPKQTESYFLSITVDKNQFRTYQPAQPQYNFFALHGKFPVSDVIKGFQNGKSIFELVNFFNFIGGGSKDIKSNETAPIVLPIDTLKFDSKFSVKAPVYGGNQFVLSLALNKNGSTFFPTDLKRIDSGKTMSLTSKSGFSAYALSILMNNVSRTYVEKFDYNLIEELIGTYDARAETDFSQLSYTLQIANATTSPTFLPHIARPTLNKATGQVTAQVPATIPGVAPYGTVVTLSEVHPGGGSSFPIDFKGALWSQTFTSWNSNYTLPQVALDLIQKGTYSLDVMFLGAAQTSADSIDWEQVTHATRNTLTF